jgi:alkylation response protein AidB-like acyl-CoA dehydrogenase
MSAAVRADRSVADRDRDVDPQDMLDRARCLVPLLAEREVAALKAREIPAVTMQDFRRSGLMRLLQPRRFGGLQSSVDLFSRIVEELANGCASSAWVYSVFGEHAWIIASMPEQGQIDVWDDNPDAVASSSLAPRSVAKTVPGGYKLSGRYPFSSGCGQAQWAIVGAFCDEPGREHRYMLVPMCDIEIIDDWEVVGLRATGSKTLDLNDVFIPDHRTALVSDMIAGNPPGRQTHPDYPLLSAPRFYLCVYSQMAVTLTLGRRAVDFVAETLWARVSGTGRRMPESELVQLKFSQSAAEIDAATLIFRTGRQAATEAVNARRTISAEEISARHRDVAFVYQLVRASVERLCDISGTSWVYDSSPLQGMLRDVLTTSSHGVVNPHMAMIPYGRLRLTGAPAARA